MQASDGAIKIEYRKVKKFGIEEFCTHLLAAMGRPIQRRKVHLSRKNLPRLFPRVEFS